MTLEIDNVELYFKTKTIIRGVYLKAETGKITGVLGSNGCGKSCLLKIIFGSLTPKYKLIRVNNKPILNSLYKTKFAAYLPQHHFIPNRIKAKTAFKLYKVSWDDFISRFPVFSSFKNLNLNKLSGGERRIIEIYLILKSDCKVILLDEPFSNIAPLYLEKIKTLINIEKQHKAIVITDHMYRHIVGISDTIYLIKKGSSKLVSGLKELEDYKYLSLGTIN